MKQIKKLFAGLLSLSLLTLCCACSSESSQEDSTVQPDPANTMTTAQLVQDMGVGWNLGNTMESCTNTGAAFYVEDCETAWGNPVTTKAMIQCIADAGFDTVRIPVAWSNMMSYAYAIDESLLDRVDEIVGYVLDCGMYAVVDLHWDQGWIQNASTEFETTLEKYTRIWEQVSARFADTDNRLLFESMNEDGVFDDVWNQKSGTQKQKEAAYDILNQLNQKFVDTVRAGGGQNETRHLLIAGYAANLKLSCDPAFQMPEDAADHCALSIHYYDPTSFASPANKENNGVTWGTTADKEQLTADLDTVQAQFSAQGIPVVLAECGAVNVEQDQASMEAYTTAVIQGALDRDICPILWDQGGFFNRTHLSFPNASLLTAIQSVMPVPAVVPTT